MLGQVISFSIRPRLPLEHDRLNSFCWNSGGAEAGVQVEGNNGPFSSRYPDLNSCCSVLMPTDSSNWSNNHDINSYWTTLFSAGANCGVCQTLRAGFRSNNTEAYFHMSRSLMWRDGLLEQHFLLTSIAAVRLRHCGYDSVNVSWIYLCMICPAELKETHKERWSVTSQLEILLKTEG